MVTDGSKRARIGTSIAAWILRERSVSELELVDLTYSKAPPPAIPECTSHEVYPDSGLSYGTYQILRQAMLHVVNG
jgi:hypothetical protein